MYVSVHVSKYILCICLFLSLSLYTIICIGVHTLSPLMMFPIRCTVISFFFTNKNAPTAQRYMSLEQNTLMHDNIILEVLAPHP